MYCELLAKIMLVLISERQTFIVFWRDICLSGTEKHFNLHYSTCSSITLGTQFINEPPHDKTNKMTVRPVMTQISLGIRPVWSVFTVCSMGS